MRFSGVAVFGMFTSARVLLGCLSYESRLSILFVNGLALRSFIIDSDRFVNSNLVDCNSDDKVGTCVAYVARFVFDIRPVTLSVMHLYPGRAVSTRLHYT